MRENTKTINSILNIAKNDTRIRVAFQTGSKVNPLEKRDDLQDHDIIFCVTNLDDFRQDFSFLEALEPVFVYSKDLASSSLPRSKDEINYIILTDQGRKVDISFRPIDQVSDLISSDTLLSLLMDKDNLIKSLPVSSDISYRIIRPTKNEYEQTIYEFFTNIIEVLPYLYRNHYTGAALAFRDIHDSLIKMLAWNLAYTKDFKLNLGKNYRHLESYLDDESLEVYKDCLEFTSIGEMWKASFACLALFRKMGLLLSDRLAYPYPKKMDVKIVGYVRETWADVKRREARS